MSTEHEKSAIIKIAQGIFYVFSSELLRIQIVGEVSKATMSTKIQI